MWYEILLLSASLPLMATASQTSKEKAPAPSALSQRDRVMFLRSFYKSAIAITSIAGRRVLVIPEPIREAHKRNRVAIVEILSEIVRVGRPEDAVRAMSFIIGMEESVAEAAIQTDAPDDVLDDFQGNLDSSLRDRLVETARSLLEKAKLPSRK